VLPEWKYESAQTRLRSGDRLVLFTDGLIEARSATDEEFGEARLIQLMSDNNSLGAGELKRLILNSAAEFNGRGLQDDLTFIVVAALS
jgi:sigma-B regulation protein RsbU (phosphoserine phosphatase)